MNERKGMIKKRSEGKKDRKNKKRHYAKKKKKNLYKKEETKILLLGYCSYSSNVANLHYFSV